MDLKKKQNDKKASDFYSTLSFLKTKKSSIIKILKIVKLSEKAFRRRIWKEVLLSAYRLKTSKLVIM